MAYSVREDDSVWLVGNLVHIANRIQLGAALHLALSAHHYTPPCARFPYTMP